MLEDVRRHPSREWRLRNHVVSLRSVLFGHFRNTVGAEPGRQPDERWPQPPVHVSHLPANQSADEDVLRPPQLPRHAPDLLCLGVSPPIASDLLARDFRRKAGHRALRRLKHDPLLLDKCQSVFNRQRSRPSSSDRPPSALHPATHQSRTPAVSTRRSPRLPRRREARGSEPSITHPLAKLLEPFHEQVDSASVNPSRSPDVPQRA